MDHIPVLHGRGFSGVRLFSTIICKLCILELSTPFGFDGLIPQAPMGEPLANELGQVSQTGTFIDLINDRDQVIR